jgi:hypothetical protein
MTASFHHAMPTVSVRAVFAPRDIRALVRIDHPRLAPVAIPVADEDVAQCLASQLRRLFDIAADAGRAEVEGTYAARLAEAQLDLLAARRMLAGCDEEET